MSPKTASASSATSRIAGDNRLTGETVKESHPLAGGLFVSVSDATIRKLIEETYGDHLSPDEVETLLPYVRRQFDSSQKLADLDLGELDPRVMNFINDRRITP